MSEPLVVALVLEPAATRVTLWQGGAQRFAERVAHGTLALAAGEAGTAAARRAVRAAAIRTLLAQYGEDAARADAYVALGPGARAAGIYAAVIAGDDESADGVALAAILAADSGSPAFGVEPIGIRDAASVMVPPERLLLACAAARRDALNGVGGLDDDRIVLSLEPTAIAVAFAGAQVRAACVAKAQLESDAERLIARIDLGDASAADELAAFAGAAAQAVGAVAAGAPAARALLLTGRLAAHASLVEELRRALEAPLPLRVVRGERVERALAELASAALIGLEPVRTYDRGGPDA